MKRISLSRPRSAQPLTDPVRKRLDAYVLAANSVGAWDRCNLGCGVTLAAVGVGLLAAPIPAHARIVYTKAHKVIHPSSSYALDVNHDGIKDFFLDDFGFSSRSRGGLLLAVAPVSSDQDQVVEKYGWASALSAGVVVGSKQFYGHASLANSMAMSACMKSVLQCTFRYYWANEGKGVTNRYLGMKFFIRGQVHYGWARLSTSFTGRLHAVLTGYAYETIPNKSIVTGKTHGPDVTTIQPATLGHLARGSSAIPAWRAQP
jgi:hypothetical protein